MRIAINDHQKKSFMLRDALEQRGHFVANHRHQGDVLLIDYDGPVGKYQETIEKQVIGGAKVFVYQHGAMPMTHYDGIHEPSDRVSGFFTFAEGHKRVMELYGYPLPIHVVGWYYCPLRPWQPVEHPKRILYAPWHPLNTGFITPMGRVLNREIMDDLHSLKQNQPDLEIRVRHVGSLEVNNVPQYSDIEYKFAYPVNEWEDIDWADVVISHGTFARLAIARGKPVVMYGQQQTPYDGSTPETYREVASHHLYREYMWYPFDYDDGPPLWDLILSACQEEPVGWKRLFIGQPFDGDYFNDLLVSLVMERVHA